MLLSPRQLLVTGPSAQVATAVFAVDRALHLPICLTWILQTRSLHFIAGQTETQVRGDPEALQGSARLSGGALHRERGTSAWLGALYMAGTCCSLGSLHPFPAAA